MRKYGIFSIFIIVIIGLVVLFHVHTVMLEAIVTDSTLSTENVKVSIGCSNIGKIIHKPNNISIYTKDDSVKISLKKWNSLKIDDNLYMISVLFYDADNYWNTATVFCSGDFERLVILRNTGITNQNGDNIGEYTALYTDDDFLHKVKEHLSAAELEKYFNR